MNSKVRVVDCDTHFWQPIELWEAQIDRPYRERVRDAYFQIRSPGSTTTSAPTAVRPTQGAAGYVDGRGPVSVEQAQRIRGGDHADARLEWMEKEGIDACVIYPTLAGAMAFHPDLDVAAAACRALNRWSSEFASHAPSRLKPCMMLPWYDPDRALKELDHALELGLSVAFATPTPSAQRRWSDSAYDPLWRALQDAGVVMTFHEFTRIPGETPNTVVRRSYKDVYAMMYLCGHTLEAQLTLMDLMFGGVFSRFPRLKIGFVEAHVAWLAGWLAMLDQQWARALSSFKERDEWGDTSIGPTALFRRQGFVVAFPDDAWINETMTQVGPDSVMISSDFPHPQARYDLVRKFNEGNPHLSEAWRSKILGENAVKIFGL